MKEIKIRNDQYDAEISYLIGGTIPDVRALMKRRYGEKAQIRSGQDTDTVDETLEDDTDGYQFAYHATQGENERFYVWVAEPTHELLAHESSHLGYDILNHRGVKHCDESEEAYAYMQGWLHKKLYERLGLGRAIKIK